MDDLPCEIILSILGHLPIVEAARTSVLSRKWRSLWNEIPQLVFDDYFFQDLKTKIEPNAHWTSARKIIFDVLLFHSGPLNTFVLSFPDPCNARDILRIITFVSKKGAKDLELIADGQGYPNIPSSFFTNDQLRSLQLFSFRFNVPTWFSGLSNLLNVELFNIKVEPTFFERFLSKCPRIERVIIGPFLCDEMCEVVIDMQNLKYLWYYGVYRSFCFKNAPLLEDVNVYDLPDDLDLNTSELTEYVFIVHLPALKRLRVEQQFLKGLSRASSMGKQLACLLSLTSLTVNDVSLGESDVVAGFCTLIKLCPNLESLKIKMAPDYDVCCAFRLLHVHEICFASLRKVMWVKICGFEGNLAELEMIRLLLCKLTSLRRMIIGCTFSPADESYIDALSPIYGFFKASDDALVVFT